jgi:hypothetical protein
VLNPNNAAGVAQLFANADNSRRIGDTILIAEDPAAAATGVDNTRANYVGKVSGTWQPVDVGSNGFMISGTSSDNTQAITVVLFTEGKALVNLEFDGGPNDPIDPGVATAIARKQDAPLKTDCLSRNVHRRRHHVGSKRTNGNRVATLTRLLAVTDLLELLVIPVKPDSREITQVIDRGPTTGLIL